MSAPQYSNEQMIGLTQAVMNHLDEWKLSPEEMINILGLPEKTKSRHLQQYRSMDKALPQTDELFKRIEHVVGISEALRTAYPFSQQMRYLWLRKVHRRFKRQTPLSVIMDEGIQGLQRVRIEVDCAYGWSISDAMRAATEIS